MNSKMKITNTVVLGLATISGANGKPSTASTASSKAAKSKSLSLSFDTKSAKSKSSKAQCIEVGSFSYLTKSGKTKLPWPAKSGKAHLSLSMSMSMEYIDIEICAPCSVGPLYLNFTGNCGTNIGFCTLSTTVSPDEIVTSFDECDANNCIPECSLLEPICEPCERGHLFGAGCPAVASNCEMTWTADAEPTCVSSDCVNEDFQCGLCETAVAGLNCPDSDGYCQIQGTDCIACNATACPDYPFSECANPPADDDAIARRLETGNEGWGFNHVFQW